MCQLWYYSIELKVKGGLISEGILTSVLLPTKCAKSLLSRKFEFPGLNSKQLIIFSAQESDLAPFVGNGTKVKKKLSDIKPPFRGVDSLLKPGGGAGNNVLGIICYLVLIGLTEQHLCVYGLYA